MLNRLLGIVYILLNKGTVTASDLAGRFEVSERTIYRDIEQLSLAGIPVYAKKGRNGGISLMDNCVLDKMVVSCDEQKKILAALVSLRETRALEEEKILQKFGDFFKMDIPDWVSIDFSGWGETQKQVFEQLRYAILDKHIVEFDYYGQYGEMSHRTVEPMQLLYKEYTWYLSAYCQKRKAMRLFKVFRMKRIQVLDDRFEVISREHNEDLYNSEDSKIIKSTEIVLQIDKKEAYRIYDRFDEEDIKILSCGDFIVSINCPVDDWLYGLILSFGPSAKVISPEFVKEEYINKAQKILKNYL